MLFEGVRYKHPGIRIDHRQKENCFACLCFGDILCIPVCFYKFIGCSFLGHSLFGLVSFWDGTSSNDSLPRNLSFCLKSLEYVITRGK